MTWSGGGGSGSIVRMPPTSALLKSPSGTPFNGTAPGIRGSALTLRRWNTGSGSLIVSRSRPRIWNSAVIRCEGVSTSTLVQVIVAPSMPAVCIAGRIARRTLRSPENGHVDLNEARRQIEARAELQAFISTSSEQGAGTVVAVKDLVDVAGMVTTAGGIILPNEPAERDAPVIDAIRARGCVVVGKTNLHEFAFGVTSVNPHFGAVLNPHDPSRVAGGSSGGSAVAVATGMCDWAIGSDTGGSIRIPSALCGVVGFKPALGSIDVAGVIPLSHSLDTLGPIAPDVASAAAAYSMMSGE